MCNYSDWVEERGIVRGERNMLTNLVKKKLEKNLTTEQIAEALEQDIDVIEGIISDIRNDREIA